MDAHGQIKATTTASIDGIPTDQIWIQVMEVSTSDTSVGYTPLGPVYVQSSPQTVPNLRIVSMSASSVLLQWDLSPILLLGWELTSSTETDSTTVFVGASSYRVTGLQTGAHYTFSVRAKSYAGLGAASSISVVTMNASSPVRSLQVVPFDDSGNVRIAWLPSASESSAEFRVRIDEEDRDGNIAALRTVSEASNLTMRTIPNLVTNQAYRFVVESSLSNLHEAGFGRPTVIHFTE